MIRIACRFLSWLLKLMGANCVYIVAVKAPKAGEDWGYVCATSYRRIRCDIGFAKEFWCRVEEDSQDQRVHVEIFEVTG